MNNKHTLKIIFYILFSVLLNLSAKADYQTERMNIYLESLQMIGDKKELLKNLLKAINITSEVKELFRLALFAEDSNITEAAEKAYRQILFFDPDNNEATIKLANLLYNTNRSSEAKFYLSKYNLSTGGDYISNYELGMIFTNEGNTDIANTLLKKSLEELDKSGKINFNKSMIKADILSCLGKYDESDKIYSKLLKKYPSNHSLRLDYIDMLIKWGKLNKASRLLSIFPVLGDKPISSRIMYRTKYLKRNYAREQLRVNVYRTSILLLQEELSKAFALVQKMKLYFPNDYEVLVSEADAYSVQGNWRQEKNLIENAIELNPGNEDLLKRYDKIKGEHTSKFSFDNLNKFTYGTASGNAVELILRESLELRLNDLISIGANTIQDFIMAQNVNFLDGTSGSYNGLKQSTEIYTQFDFEGNDYLNASTLRLSYFISDNYNFMQNSGLGLTYKYLDNYGSTNLELYFRQPYLDLPVAVINGANRNRIMIGRELKLMPELNIYADIGFNNYGARDQFNLDNSLEYHVTLSYTLPAIDLQKKYLGSTSKIGINYFLDSEIFFTSKEGINSAGNTYRILPLDNRLVNTVALSYYNEFTSSFRLYLLAGYAIDAMGDISNGPVASIELTYVINKYLEANFNASHYIGTTTSTYVGGGLKLNYIKLINDIWSKL